MDGPTIRQMRLQDFPGNREGRFLKGVISGETICEGMLSYEKAGQRTHSFDGL